MRPFQDVLVMWGLCDDRELLDWQWMYERLLRKDPGSKHADYILQDLSAISQHLQERNLM